MISENEQKKIRNYLINRYKKIFKENLDLRRASRTNILITSYFKRSFYHMHSDDIDKRIKFFFSYRKKYKVVFELEKKHILNKIRKFKRGKKVNEFKNRFTQDEWRMIQGENLLALIALEDDFSANEKKLQMLRTIINVATKKYKNNEKYYFYNR